MQQKALSLLPIIVISVIATSPAWAEVTTKTGNTSGTVAKADVNSTGKTTVRYRKTDVDPDSDPGPMPFDGEWTFGWDSAKPATVTFAGVIHLGNYSTDTHAKAFGMNFNTVQTFYDFAQHVKGTAQWDGTSRTLTYTMDPGERDDGRASTVSESKPPICVEENSRACKAFFKTSSALEGLRLNLTFSEDLNRFDGEVVLIQYGGKGMEKATVEISLSLRGELAEG